MYRPPSLQSTPQTSLTFGPPAKLQANVQTYNLFPAGSMGGLASSRGYTHGLTSAQANRALSYSSARDTTGLRASQEQDPLLWS